MITQQNLQEVLEILEFTPKGQVYTKSYAKD